MNDSAQRPRRRFRKHDIVAVVLLVLAVPVILSGIQVFRISTAVPSNSRVHVDALQSLIETQNPLTPGEPNAFDLMTDAAAICSRISIQSSDALAAEAASRFGYEFEYVSVSGEYLHSDMPGPNARGALDPESDSWPEANRLVRQRSADALQAMDHLGLSNRLDDLVSVGSSRPPMPDGSLSDGLPMLTDVRRVSRWERGRLELSGELGQWQQVRRSTRRLLSLSSHVSRDPNLISWLVGTAINRGVCRSVVEIITRRAIPADEIAVLQDILERQPPLASLSYILEGERLMTLHQIEKVHSDDGKGSGYFLPAQLQRAGPPNAPPRASIKNIRGLGFPRKAETVETTNLVYDRLRQMGEQTRAERLLQPELGIEIPESQILLQIMLPAFDSIFRAKDRYESNMRATLIALAIERHRAESGALPDSLSLLVPHNLAELPQDPFSESGQFLYRIDESQEPGYTLYSVGPNAFDDGGHRKAPGDPDESGDLVTVPVAD